MDRVGHFEVPYSDKDRAQEFYAKVFGWQFQDLPDGMPYSFAITTPVDEQMQPQTAGGINGGMYPREDDISTSPVIVIEVESCEQRVKDIEAAGGSVVKGPHTVGDMGIYAQVKDTEDNIIGLWQSLREP